MKSHFFHRWGTPQYESHGGFGSVVNLRVQYCTVPGCKARKMRTYKGLKAKKRRRGGWGW